MNLRTKLCYSWSSVTASGRTRFEALVWEIQHQVLFGGSRWRWEEQGYNDQQCSPTTSSCSISTPIYSKWLVPSEGPSLVDWVFSLISWEQAIFNQTQNQARCCLWSLANRYFLESFRGAKPAEQADSLFFFFQLVNLLLPRSPLVLFFFLFRIRCPCRCDHVFSTFGQWDHKKNNNHTTSMKWKTKMRKSCVR